MGGSSSKLEQIKRDEWEVVQKKGDYEVLRNRQDPDRKLEQYSLFLDGDVELNREKKVFSLRKNHPQLVSAEYFDTESTREFCSQHHKCDLYLEHTPMRLAEVQHVPNEDSMHLAEQCIHGYSDLSQELGFFPVDESMIGIRNDGVVKVWASSNFASTTGVKRENYDEDRMVKSIIDVIYKTCENTSQAPFLAEYLLHSAQPLTFKAIDNGLKSYATQYYNGKIPQAFDCVVNQGGAERVVEMRRQTENLPEDNNYDSNKYEEEATKGLKSAFHPQEEINYQNSPVGYYPYAPAQTENNQAPVQSTFTNSQTNQSQNNTYVLRSSFNRPPTTIYHNPAPTTIYHNPAPTTIYHNPAPTTIYHNPAPTIQYQQQIVQQRSSQILPTVHKRQSITFQGGSRVHQVNNVQQPLQYVQTATTPTFQQWPINEHLNSSSSKKIVTQNFIVDTNEHKTPPLHINASYSGQSVQYITPLRPIERYIDYSQPQHIVTNIQPNVKPIIQNNVHNIVFNAQNAVPTTVQTIKNSNNNIQNVVQTNTQNIQQVIRTQEQVYNQNGLPKPTNNNFAPADIRPQQVENVVNKPITNITHQQITRAQTLPIYQNVLVSNQITGQNEQKKTINNVQQVEQFISNQGVNYQQNVNVQQTTKIVPKPVNQVNIYQQTTNQKNIQQNNTKITTESKQQTVQNNSQQPSIQSYSTNQTTIKQSTKNTVTSGQNQFSKEESYVQTLKTTPVIQQTVNKGQYSQKNLSSLGKTAVQLTTYNYSSPKQYSIDKYSYDNYSKYDISNDDGKTPADFLANLTKPIDNKISKNYEVESYSYSYGDNKVADYKNYDFESKLKTIDYKNFDTNPKQQQNYDSYETDYKYTVEKNNAFKIKKGLEDQSQMKYSMTQQQEYNKDNRQDYAYEEETYNGAIDPELEADLLRLNKLQL